MKNTNRVPLAPGEPMPALDGFLRPFHIHFRRSEARHALERYLTGMLTEHPNKNCDTIAQVVPGTSEQSLQGLLTSMSWDEDDLNEQRVRTLLALPTEGDAALLFDDTGFAKQGKSSVGVARQYSGTLGKTGNCQVTVNCHYAERTIAWPVSTRLYLGKGWAYDQTRRARAKVPEDVEFQTKPQIALALLDRADEMGVPYAGVMADADYGDNPNFLEGLEDRKKRSVVAIRKDFQVALTSDGPPQRAEVVLAVLQRRRWQRPGGQVEVPLEQLRRGGSAGGDGGVRAPALRGGEVPRGGQGTAGLGPVPGQAVDRLPPQQCAGDAG